MEVPGAVQRFVFEEIEASELNGNGRDFIEGFGVGVTVVAGIAGIVALT